MRMEWSDDELVASRTLVGEDWALVGNKIGATRLGFAVLLKFFEIEARFPRSAAEVPPPAMSYLAEQLKLAPEVFTGYDWSAPRYGHPPGPRRDRHGRNGTGGVAVRQSSTTATPAGHALLAAVVEGVPQAAAGAVPVVAGASVP